MKLKSSHIGAVENGKFKPNASEPFRNAFKQFEGGKCEVVIQAPQKQRSNRQNKYMWKIVYGILSDWSGDDVNSIHLQMCAMFASPKVITNKLQEEVVIQGSTSRMTTIEIEEYLSRIRAWASMEHGVFIPLPNEAPE